MTTLFPIVTADVALFTVIDGTLRVLLLQRDNQPQAGAWALPGALLKPDKDDSLEQTARRALADKTRVDIPHLEQVSVFSSRERDPRGYSVAVLFYALLPAARLDLPQKPGMYVFEVQATSEGWVTSTMATTVGELNAISHGSMPELESLNQLALEEN